MNIDNNNNNNVSYWLLNMFLYTQILFDNDIFFNILSRLSEVLVRIPIFS